jgi:hypothetical protein
LQPATAATHIQIIIEETFEPFRVIMVPAFLALGRWVMSKLIGTAHLPAPIISLQVPIPAIGRIWVMTNQAMARSRSLKTADRARRRGKQRMACVNLRSPAG